MVKNFGSLQGRSNALMKSVPRGGFRAGAGRNPSPETKIAVTARLSEDSVLWLRRQKNQAKALEKAIHREAIASDPEGQCPICQKPFDECEYFRGLGDWKIEK